MEINPRGYWESPLNVGHGVDTGLCKALVKFFQNVNATSVIDMGCGNGYYTNYLNMLGIPTVGVDGNPHTASL